MPHPNPAAPSPERKVKKIAILGCGWMGLPLGEALVKEGYRVNGSTTTPEKTIKIAGAGMSPYVFRVDPGTTLTGAGDFFDVDVLFLDIPPGRRDPDVETSYPARVRAVVEALHGTPVRHVVLAGSTSVYPDLNREVTEDDAGDPGSASGRALLAAEALLQAADGFETTILRFGGLYGYDRQPGRFLAGRTGVDGGEAPVNLIHRDDCLGIVAAVVAQDVRGVVLNACADAHPTRRALYTAAARRLGLVPPVFSDAPAAYKIVSNRRLKETLGYRFRHPDPLADLS